MGFRPLARDIVVMSLIHIIETTDVPLNTETENFLEVLKKREKVIRFEEWLATQNSDESGEADHA